MIRRNLKENSISGFNKRGQLIVDLAVVGLMLFILALLSLFGARLFKDMNNDIQTDATQSEIGKNISQNLYDRYYDTTDSAFAVVFVIIWIALIVSSFNINTHPVFFGIMCLIMLFFLLAAAFFGNTYEEFSTSDELSDVAPNFTIQNFVMGHFFETMAVVGFSVIISMYMKTGAIR